MGTWGQLPGEVEDAGYKGVEGSWQVLGGFSGLWAPQAERLRLLWETLVEVLW